MFCKNCGKENPDQNKFCLQCGSPLKNELGTNTTAYTQPPTIRIKCRKKKNIVRRILFFPYLLFPHYNIYVYIDDQVYTMSSKEGQRDFTVSPGVHRIFLYHKKINRQFRNKVNNIVRMAGEAVQFTAAIGGDSSLYGFGTALKYTEDWDGSEDIVVEMVENELFEIPVKANYFDYIRIDPTL